MPFLISLFTDWGLSERIAKVLGFVVPAVLAIALVGGLWAFWLHSHDKHVITNHDAVQAAQVSSTELQAERTAEANDAVRRDVQESQAKDLNDARDNAIRSNPDEASKSAGPATRAVLGELRRQQAGNQHAAAK